MIFLRNLKVFLNSSKKFYILKNYTLVNKSFSVSYLNKRFQLNSNDLFKILKLNSKNVYLLNLNSKYSTSNLEENKFKRRNDNNAIWYILSTLVLMIGATYAAVPLFKIFCESQGIDANSEMKDMNVDNLKKILSTIKRVDNKNINIKFVASTSTDLQWSFEPSQNEIKLVPGETALAFYKAKNLTNRSIVGIGKLL